MWDKISPPQQHFNGIPADNLVLPKSLLSSIVLPSLQRDS